MQNLWGSRLKAPGYTVKPKGVAHKKRLGSFEFRIITKFFKFFKKVLDKFF